MNERTGLAEDRTNLAEDRTVLAHERSFAGWLRTGMASVGIALGFNALFRAVEPQWVSKLIATAFLGVAASIFLSTERRACTIITKAGDAQGGSLEAGANAPARLDPHRRNCRTGSRNLEP